MYTLIIDNHKNTVRGWSKVSGVSVYLIRKRMRAGFPDRYCVFHPPRSPISVTFRGETRTIKEWAKITGIGYKTLFHRYQHGVHGATMFVKPYPTERNKFEYEGRKQSLESWSKELKIPRSTLEKRLKSGWTVDRAFSERKRRPVHWKISVRTNNNDQLIGYCRGTDSMSWRQIMTKFPPFTPARSRTIHAERVNGKEYKDWLRRQSAGPS